MIFRPDRFFGAWPTKIIRNIGTVKRANRRAEDKKRTMNQAQIDIVIFLCIAILIYVFIKLEK